MLRSLVVGSLALAFAAAPADAARKCNLKGATTVASNAEARVFSVKGKGDAKRLYFGCLRGARPVLLTTDLAPRGADEDRTSNSFFRLGGTWVGWHHTSTSDTGAGEFSAGITVRSLAGARRLVLQDTSRYALKSLKIAADGTVGWVLASGVFREVDGVAASASEPTPLAVAVGIDSKSLSVTPGRVSFRQGTASRTLRVVAPAAQPRGIAVGPQGLDGRFGDCGTLVPATPKPNVFTEATQLARTPDGAIVAAGTATSGKGDPLEQDTFVVSRFSAAGRFDPTFGGTGVVQLPVPRPAGAQNAELTGAVVQPDGRVVVAGHVALEDPNTAEAILARFNPDGSLDPSFGSGGIARDAIPATASVTVRDLALDTDGTLLVVGKRDGRYYVARLSGDGTLDPTFGTGGIVADAGKDASELSALALQPDRTIVAAGSSGTPLLMRLTPGGALLSISGAAPPATVNLTALEPTADGGVVAIGVASNIRAVGQLVLARYTPAGKPDTNFSGDGFVLDPQISRPGDVAIAPDGSLFVTAGFLLQPGDYTGSGLIHFTGAGARDTSFGLRGALGGISSFGISDHEILVSDDGTALVAQDNGGGYAVSRFAVGAPAVSEAASRSTVCAMATATALAPLLAKRKLEVSLRLRAPGTLRLDATVRVGARTIKAGQVTVFRPFTEGAVASIPLTKAALQALRGTRTARLTVTAGAPGRAKTTYTATLTR